MSLRLAVFFVFFAFFFAWGVAMGQKKDVPAFPPAEEAVKNDVDPWGLPFSDDVRRFEKAFAAFEAKFRQAHPDVASLNYCVGIETSLRKVWRNKWWFKGQIADVANISACRNESESFQIAVMPKMGKELRNVKVDWTGLKGPGEISKANVKLYNVQFVKTLRAQYPTKHTGYWPDPLMPMQPFAVTGLDLGLLWCDVKVPKDAAPGDYEGTVTIRPEAEPPMDVKVQLHVWNFELPDRVPFRMTVWPQTREPKDWKKQMPAGKFLEYCDMFLEHHVDPCTIGSSYVDLKDLSALDNNIQHCLDRGMQIFQAPRLKKDEEMKVYYSHIKEKGWLDKCFLYGAHDEPTTDIFNAEVIPDTAKIRQHYPGLRVLLATEWHPNLDKGVDIFMTDVSTGLESYGTQERPRGNEELWWYFCHLPIHIDFTRPLVEAPNMEIDNDAIEHRIAYWMMWRYDVRGCFIWNGNSWPHGLNANWPADEWVVQEDKPSPYPYGGIHNGNGYLFYPGPTPSIRLKVLRDGAEDYGYLLALKAAKDRLSGQDKNEAEELLKITPALLVNTHYFTRDPNALLDYRARVARLIETASGK